MGEICCKTLESKPEIHSREKSSDFSDYLLSLEIPYDNGDLKLRAKSTRLPICCKYCAMHFGSKNSLFTHIKKEHPSPRRKEKINQSQFN